MLINGKFAPQVVAKLTGDWIMKPLISPVDELIMNGLSGASV